MTPRQWLETAVDGERANELIKHRQRLRKPLTDYAAKLLAKKLSACPDPNAAADMCIEKGWQSIEPGWVQNSQQRALTQPNKPRNIAEASVTLLARMRDADNAQRPHANGELFEHHVPHLAAPASERGPERSPEPLLQHMRQLFE